MSLFFWTSIRGANTNLTNSTRGTKKTIDKLDNSLAHVVQSFISISLSSLVDPAYASPETHMRLRRRCLLYTSDAADDMQCVDLGGRRIIKKNPPKFQEEHLK